MWVYYLPWICGYEIFKYWRYFRLRLRLKQRKNYLKFLFFFLTLSLNLILLKRSMIIELFTILNYSHYFVQLSVLILFYFYDFV